MKYYSLNHNSKPTLFQDAVKRGLAPDRGLYFPETITKLPNTFFEEIEDMSITEMAYKVIKPYIGNQIKKEKKIEQPIAIKISPDIGEDDIGRIVELVKSQKIQGIIVSNTTDNNRENLSDIKKNEAGGLSGQPLKDISTDLIKKFYKETKGEVQIIGVGGVDSGQSAFEKITAGADAVQLYTGMVYKGPGIVKEIKKELISILKKENLKNISEAVGINA